MGPKGSKHRRGKRCAVWSVPSTPAFQTHGNYAVLLIRKSHYPQK